MKKIAVIFGTRPEAIKLCPVILELKKHPEFDCHVCVTGQHREMLDQVLHMFGVIPDVDLKLMRPDQTLGGLTARAIEAIDKYLTIENPDAVIVQGDTTTVFCAALAAFYHHIPVAHVEAGLRTWNMFSPWPEEANRVLTTRLAHWHFAPTEMNRQNLLKEGVSDTQIYVVGNTVIDALFYAREKVALPEWLDRLSHADFVLTNSFHGTVFAILFHKPFIALLLNGPMSGMNERLISLLQAVGLPERMIYAKDLGRIPDFLNHTSINWGQIDQTLDQMRRSSQLYFDRARL